VQVFATRGEAFEWKLRGHDRPAGLAERLRRAGLVPEPEETVLIAPVEAICGEVRLPAGVLLREVEARPDLDRIVATKAQVWADDPAAPADLSWLAASLEAERSLDPDALTILCAQAGGAVVSSAWVRFEPASDFATLWGGGTLPAWRRRGIYRALVTYRANLASGRGLRYLQVDASPNSRPILERLGFVAVTTTTPYLWSPSTSR
jgi:GNAT superfamily N-acetyltransferase